MDNKINFKNLILYLEELETDEVKTPNINPTHSIAYHEDNYYLFEQIVKFCRYMYSDMEDPDNPDHDREINILEIGSGVGISTLHWLACDKKTNVTSIDLDTSPHIEKNMTQLKDWFLDRYQYEIVSSVDYNYILDPLLGSYDLVVIDGGVETLEHDLKLVEKIRPKLVWCMNSDTEGWMDTSPILDSLLPRDDYAYYYEHNLMLKIQKYLTDTENGKTGDDIGVLETWEVNSSLLRLLEVQEGEESPEPGWKKNWPEDSDGTMWSLRFIKGDGQVYAGVSIDLDTSIDPTNGEVMSVTIHSAEARDITLKLDTADIVRTSSHTGSGWETLSFDFTGEMPLDQKKISFFNDLTQLGNGTDAWTIYIDNLAQTTNDESGDVFVLEDFQNPFAEYDVAQWDGGGGEVVRSPV